MKKLITFLLTVLLYISANAQEETLISGQIESGGYGGPLVQIGQIHGGTGLFVGGQGGWIINHRFVIGGKGYGLVNIVNIGNAQNLKLEFGCGGALLEYIISPNKLIHFSIQSMIGAGGVRYAVKDYTKDHDEVNYTADAFFILEPGINLILNVTKIFRIGAGATFRYINGVKYESMTNSDLNGLSAHILLKFGEF